MTTEINPYHTSKIYRISSPQCEKFYIGSTTTTLSRRLSEHKSLYKRYIEKGIGCCSTSFEIIKFDDVIIELIKEIKCENRKELDRIEGVCILEHHDRILNKNVAGRTKKEYYEIIKEKIKETKKEYYEIIKEKIKETNKEYYEVNKEKIKETKKKYYEAKKDKYKELYKANKDKLCEKIDCDCGGKYTLGHKSKHEKTQRHIDFLNSAS